MAEIIEKPKSLSDTAKDIARRFLRHENAILIIILAALIAGISALSHGLTTSRVNMMNILLQSSTRGVAAIGQAFVILTAGIDVSVGGAGLMCSVLGASLMTTDLENNIIGYPASMYVAIPLMLLAGLGWGAINGSSVSRIGMPPLIVTLAMWQITSGVAFRICEGRSVEHLSGSFAFFGQSIIAGVPVPVIIFISVAVVAYFVLNHTTFGKAVYAVGGNPVSAWLSGIKVRNIIMSVYVISGFLAGLAGVIFASRTMSASMNSLLGLELDCIGATVVGGISLMGGRGSLIGVIIGVIIIGVINNAMSVLGVSPAWMGIAKGAIIFSAVAIDTIRRRG